MKIYKIALNHSSILSSDQMAEFIMDSKLKNWSGELDYSDAKEIANSSKQWELVKLPLTLFDWVVSSDYHNESSQFPPIVLLTENMEYEVLDGKHRIGMANDRGDKQIEVYLGKLNT